MGTPREQAASQARAPRWSLQITPPGGRGGLQSKLAVPLVQLHPSWRKVGERPRPRGWRHRSPGPLSSSPRAGCARLVRPQPLLPAAPAARAAGDCQLLVRKSSHILASRGMKRGEHQDEVLNSYILGAREARFWDGSDSEGKRLERSALLALLTCLSQPEIRRWPGAQSLFIFRCV